MKKFAFLSAFVLIISSCGKNNKSSDTPAQNPEGVWKILNESTRVSHSYFDANGSVFENPEVLIRGSWYPIGGGLDWNPVPVTYSENTFCRNLGFDFFVDSSFGENHLADYAIAFQEGVWEITEAINPLDSITCR